MKKNYYPWLFLVSGMLAMSGCAEQVTPADWPQFKKDNYRSGCIEAEFRLEDFGRRWTVDTGQEPVPAWYGPAKEDAYARSGPLPSMRDYDLSYSPVIVGNSLYYASSADDAVHCHDASTGRERWHFTTKGPIRIAPTFYDGKLYVGSDDGYVYCLNAFNGKLKWKFSATPQSSDKLLNNGRFISFYPVRTGVMIEDGIAYFGASLMPWKKSYICAIDAVTGKVGKPGTYVKEYDTNSMTLEGAMASTGKLLIQPQGRISPVFIQKESGETAGSLTGSGGCFVLVTPEKNVIHGETSRRISIQETTLEKKQPKFMSYNNGKEIVVQGEHSYVLNDNSLVSYNRSTKKMNWLRQNFQAHRIIIAGDVLFAGKNDRVEGISLHNGQTLWSCDVKGTVYALSFARNVLYASTSEGYLYAFGEGGKDGVYHADRVAIKPVVEDKIKEEKPVIPHEMQSQICEGPYIQPCSADSVDLTFYTYHPMITTVDWNLKGEVTTYTDRRAGYEHHFRIPVTKGRNYDYCLKDASGRRAQFNYDNFFNFFTRATNDFPKADAATENIVRKYINQKGVHTGLCLVMGDNSNQTALALASMTPMNIVNLEPSHAKYAYFVEQLQGRQSYGRKLSALPVENLYHIPIISEMADLVWVNAGLKTDPDEVIRLIAPKQYAVIRGVKDVKRWLSRATLDWQVTIDYQGDDYLILQKNPIENIGVWTHQHGDLRNASYGGESLYGSTQTTDFETQWMGRPGARFITDRSGRKPAPLAISGRLFMQGKERIAAMSVYNGSLLWMKDIPGMMRMNVSRDCSNWACDESYLFVVSRNTLMRIDQQTGEVVQTYGMQLPNDTTCHWGYIGVLSDQLIGSTTTKEAQFTVYHGGGNEGWYDAKQGPNSYKVISNRLFSVDKQSGDLTWEYLPKGAIINPTIAVYGEKLVFVESRSVNAESKRSGRGGDDLYQDTHLVAINCYTGELIYDQPFRTIEAKTAYYLAANTGKCVVVASYDKMYDIHTFDIETGKEVWKQQVKWFHSDHGAHMSKPAIAGDRLVVKPYIYNLHTGQQETYNMPKAGHGCAHYALSDNAIFYRGGSCTMFDFDTRVFSKWERLRPDCWLSTIPAQGMILSPEAAGGCSCGLWYETSMVFAPISRAPIAIKAHTDDSKRDYKDEVWGKYYDTCNTNQFSDSLVVELTLKPGLNYPIYYTTDGSKPTQQSSVYNAPIVLKDNAEVKAAVYIQKAGKERRFERSRTFQFVEKKVETKKEK